MSEEKKPKIKLNPMVLIRVVEAGIILGIALFVFSQLNGCKPFSIIFPDHIGEADSIMGYKDAEITDMIATESRQVQELIVYEQDLEAAMDITDMFLDIEWFKKTQTVHMKATAEYTVDLTKIKDEDIVINRNEKTITVTIPRAKLKSVSIDFKKTTFDDVERNIFGWGDIKLTPVQQNEVETRLQDALFAEASETPYLASADMSAMRQLQSIYKKALTKLKDDVNIVIVLDMNLNE